MTKLADNNVTFFTETKKTRFYEGSWCTPIYFGLGTCVDAKVENDKLVLELIGKTPIGDYKKDFTITRDILFSWSPISLVKLDIEITSFERSLDYLNFDFTVVICGDTQLKGRKDFIHSHHFAIPADNRN